MIKINREHLGKFGRSSYGYVYTVKYGVVLSFNLETLEYQGVETYFNPYNVGKVYMEAERKLGELYAKGIIEIYD